MVRYNTNNKCIKTIKKKEKILNRSEMLTLTKLQITQKLQSSLSTAKGRLSRVGGRLAGDSKHCESPKSVVY